MQTITVGKACYPEKIVKYIPRNVLFIIHSSTYYVFFFKYYFSCVFQTICTYFHHWNLKHETWTINSVKHKTRLKRYAKKIQKQTLLLVMLMHFSRAPLGGAGESLPLWATGRPKQGRRLFQICVVLSFSTMSKIKSIIWPQVVLFGDSITQVGEDTLHTQPGEDNSSIKTRFMSFSFLSKPKDGALIWQTSLRGECSSLSVFILLREVHHLGGSHKLHVMYTRG